MKKEILKSIEKKIDIKVAKAHDPQKFFVDRKGLYIGYGFESNIRANAQPTKAGAKFQIESFDLLESASDKVIENNLPKDHLFSETDVCAIIAGLIEKQPKRQKGTLLNTGYANLFYTKSRVVRVGWGAGLWFVDDWYRGGNVWDGGGRVFTPATEI